jgi:hypothetical protein
MCVQNDNDRYISTWQLFDVSIDHFRQNRLQVFWPPSGRTRLSDDDMIALVCERFEIVWPLAIADQIVDKMRDSGLAQNDAQVREKSKPTAS